MRGKIAGVQCVPKGMKGQSMKRVIGKWKDERGAIFVEATISLPVFVFAIFIILSIINICYVQAKVGTALNAAAKEISEYSYLYYALKGDEAEQNVMKHGDDVDSMVDNVNKLIDSGVAASDAVAQGDVAGAVEAVQNGVETGESFKGQVEAAVKDPVGFVIGIFSNGLIEVLNDAKSGLAGIIAKGFMQKNLAEVSDGDSDAFLKRLKVVGGMGGLDFTGTEWLVSNTADNSTAGNVKLCVTYDVQVVQLMGFEKTLTFSQVAESAVWGNGGDSYKSG